MEAITKRFITPPVPAQVIEKKHVYPWEHTELVILCQRLYTLAANTGFEGTLEEFKERFGVYLQNHNIFTSEDFDKYNGQYEVTPLPLVEQILQTRNTVLENDIVIQPIPFHEVDNAAGGRTITIG